MAEKKESMRKEMLETLANLDAEERAKISEQLATNLTKTDLWKNATRIGIYLSFGNEWETRKIIEKAWAEGKKIAIPKTIPKTKAMEFYQIDDYSQVQKGHFDIEEPLIEEAKFVEKDSINLLVVPGLVFSKDGYRIGFGGGYYDRFLTDFIHPTVSLVSEKQLRNSIPINQYDLPVHYLITEERIIK